ncbi:MAG: carboxypeptidase-like regulatory domain-containing protein, partial [Chitinophagaceae bacterium]|nr:carboxypeptidase-like regulatory domain-containing protein [Chitinophagaceae bacterium]
MRRHLLQLMTVLAMVLLAGTAWSQVTTSSITGTVKDAKGQALEGATIRAEHQPSGTTYSAYSGKGGVFIIPGMRTGGPYRVQVSFTGLKTSVFEDITLILGEAFNITA